MKKYRRLDDEKLSLLSEFRKEKVKRNDTGRYHITSEENDYILTGLEKASDLEGIDISTIDHYWYKGKHYSIHAKNDNKPTLDAIISTLKASLDLKPLPIPETGKSVSEALKLAISDCHVGMNPNKAGESLFQYEWNKDLFNAHIDQAIKAVCEEAKNKVYEICIIDDFGDGLDGFNGQTTRKSHDLPQNMTNTEAFLAYVNGRVKIITSLVTMGVAKKYLIRSAVNDNHAGSFGSIANNTVKLICELLYPNLLEFEIIERFMGHTFYGDHCFIITHGKDKHDRKFGLPYLLNPKVEQFIKDYIEHYEIRSKYIHVEKGDMHQAGYQRCKLFDYRNFMSFAPPSGWVQNNFGDAYAGFSIQVVPKNSGSIKHIDHYFDLKKTKNERR